MKYRDELMKALGQSYYYDNGMIYDQTVQGFNENRNVARVSFHRDYFTVNAWRGYFYKNSEDKKFTDVKEAAAHIKECHAKVIGNGKNV
jgi:hypothetical protein